MYNDSLCIDYGKNNDKNDEMKDDDLIELFENGFCNSKEIYVACKEEHGKCMECFCSSDHFIMSPNHPEKYPSNVDMKWLLKFHPGQRIKIDVQFFEIDISWT